MVLVRDLVDKRVIWNSVLAVVQEPQEVVSTIPGLFSNSELAGKSEDTFDVLVCGGTLGIFIATALSSKGLRVGIVERNLLKGVLCFLTEGIARFCLFFEEQISNHYPVWWPLFDDQREQEWNISKKELLKLVEVGILTEDDIDQAIAASFNPVCFYPLFRRIWGIQIEITPLSFSYFYLFISFCFLDHCLFINVF